MTVLIIITDTRLHLFINVYLCTWSKNLPRHHQASLLLAKHAPQHNSLLPQQFQASRDRENFCFGNEHFNNIECIMFCIFYLNYLILFAMLLHVVTCCTCVRTMLQLCSKCIMTVL